MMNQDKVKQLVLAGLMCAVIAVLTMFISIPIPGVAGGYVNAGDAGVYLAAFLLGGPLGAAAAGVGSALADLLLGSMIYAPATLVIKAGMAYVAAMLYGKISGWKQIFVPLAGGLVMTAGYFLYECLIYGPATAAVSIPFNLMQAAGGAVIAFFITPALVRLRKNRPADH